jgi:hypothetical protein
VLLLDSGQEAWRVIYANPAAQALLVQPGQGPATGACVRVEGCALQQLLGPHLAACPGTRRCCAALRCPGRGCCTAPL